MRQRCVAGASDAQYACKKSKAYIAPQTAKCCCSGALHHRRAAYRPWAKPRGTATKQPHAALVCRLMVFTLILHLGLITWFTTHFPTPKGWKAELAWLVDP